MRISDSHLKKYFRSSSCIVNKKLIHIYFFLVLNTGLWTNKRYSNYYCPYPKNSHSSLYISDFLSEFQPSEADCGHWQLWETEQGLNIQWLIFALIEIALNDVTV